ADDRALDLRARVDPDDGGAVEDRVVVGAAGGAAERELPAARPDGGLRVAEVELAEALRGEGVRADEEPRAGERAPVRAQRGHPPPDELRLVRRDEVRRADVEHDRPGGVEPDL